jgi:hypothetical protein
MEAGPELDALVAEKAMGWTLKRYENGAISITSPKEMYRPFISAPEISSRHLWRPSRDIAAAWQVVEKMQSMGYVVTIDQFNLTDGRTLYACYFAHPEEEDEHYAETSTVPAAICLAALTVMEAKA